MSKGMTFGSFSSSVADDDAAGPLDPRMLSAILAGGAVMGLLSVLLGALTLIGVLMGTDQWLLYVVGTMTIVVGGLTTWLGLRLLRPVLAYRDERKSDD